MLGHRALNVQDYLAILKRRWWLIAIPTVLLPFVGYGATFFITPQYISQTLVIIQQQQVPEDYVRPVVNEDLDSRLASMREQILSRFLIQPIVEKYNLYGTGMTMDARVELARSMIAIKPIHSDVTNSNGLPGFYISFKASDPHIAQQVCDDVTSLFLKQNVATRTEMVEDTTNFLLSQRDDAKRILDDQDKKLADFQRQYAGQLPGDAGTNVNMMSTLTTQLEAATEQIATMESNKTYMEGLLAQQAQPSTPAGAAATISPQTQQTELDRLIAEEADLAAHYQPDYPDLKAKRRQIADLRKEMANAASAPPPVVSAAAPPAPNRAESATVQELRARLRSLDQAIQTKHKEQDQIQQQVHAYQARVQSTPQVEEEYKALTRDNNTAHENYDSLNKKINESKMATDLESRQQGEKFKIMDAANLPDSPIYPKRTVFAIAGLGGGLGLGLLIVALIEYKDTALRSERDVWAFTQLPTLAVIAWSGDVAHTQPSRLARLKRLFSRKPPKELLADAPG